MNRSRRIVLIHATKLAIDPVETAARTHWSEVETVSVLDEALSIDRAQSQELTPDLVQRIIDLTRYAESARADGVLFTCSAFGDAIDKASRSSPIPVMKPNEAMFDQAFAYGERATMIYTFASAADGMQEEFKAAAIEKQSQAILKTVACTSALTAKKAGDDKTHDRLIAQAAADVTDTDVILLAQFSMASAASAVRNKVSVPVLTSPEAAILEMRRRLDARQT